MVAYNAKTCYNKEKEQKVREMRVIMTRKSGTYTNR